MAIFIMLLFVLIWNCPAFKADSAKKNNKLSVHSKKNYYQVLLFFIIASEAIIKKNTQLI
jgi:hypothetical protein